MKPTVTIDLEEYQNLKNVEDSILQTKDVAYYIYDGRMYVTDQQDIIDSVKMEYREKHNELIQANDNLNAEITRLNKINDSLNRAYDKLWKEFNSKKWYQFWK